MASESKEGKQMKQTEKGAGAERHIRTRAMNPLEEMERMFAEYFPRSFLQPFGPPLGWRGTLAAEWEPQVPRIDVLDKEDQVVIRAELPGVTKEGLDVAVRDNSVTIKASTQHEEEEEEGNYYRRELRRGSFSRTVALPVDVDGTNAKASFKDGILELSLPKAEHARAHHVPVE